MNPANVSNAGVAGHQNQLVMPAALNVSRYPQLYCQPS